jgi:dephospho-CoA kinase
MRPKIIGLTGGIGSGKSLVRTMFAELGVPTSDADLVARQIHQDPAHPATKEIANTFPHAISPDGRLKRGSLREFFARDATANEQLKSILRPHVEAAMRAWTQQQSTPYVVWESALIIEANISVDRILLIDAPPALQLTRIATRNPDWSREEAERILAMQTDRAHRASRAHDTILNDGTIDELRRQVDTLHRRYLELWG